MARILFGVMGDARGHVNRALTLAKEMPQHEFLFVGGGRTLDLKSEGYAVENIPVMGTMYRNNSVDVPRTVANAVQSLLGRGRVVRRVESIVRSFDPDIILSDYEYFSPLAARKMGRDCISIDHQHVLTHCRYEPPRQQRLSRLMTTQSVARLFSNTSRFVIISFFHLPPRNPQIASVLPPLIRRSVTAHEARPGEHVLVYQTSPTFHRLFPVLEQVKAQFVIYGFGERPARKNLVFKAPSDHGFLEDLATCRYAIVNGGHNVISEALYLGKPVLAFPIANAYEQFFNCHFLAQLSYGSYSLASDPSPRLLEEFASNVDTYEKAIGNGNFFGNAEVAAYVEELISGR
jgi:uncharacterized protein (TIGR00661 family)